MERQCSNTRAMTEYLARHDRVKNVYYPGLPGHPEHERATALFRHPGALFSFELADEVDLWSFLNHLKVIVKSSNLGDNRTLAIPVAHTIYFEMGPERRASMGIDDSLIRISVGIEDEQDLIGDLDKAFAAAGG
jgi:O-acetylhomoserine (thiol)-lyase